MRIIALMLTVLACAAVARSAADDPQSPRWRDAGKVLIVFGNVERSGIYEFPRHSTVSLNQLMNTLGMKAGEDVVVILYRPTADGAKAIQARADRLKEEGDIPLQPNDVIQVLQVPTAKRE